MIRITYEFQTEDEALRFLARDMAHESEVTVNFTEAAPKKRGRSPKAAAPVAGEAQQGTAKVGAESVAVAPKLPDQPVKVVAAAPKPVAPVTGAPPSPPPSAATLDNVRNALREVFNTKGAATATEILKKFGAARISDVKPEQYVAFIAACS